MTTGRKDALVELWSLTFENEPSRNRDSNVKFQSSTRIISLLVVLKIPTFANEGAANGMQMLESNHWLCGGH